MTIRIFALCCLFAVPARAATEPLDLFTGTGKAPRHTYRIPTLSVTKRGTLLAFAELRKNNASDTGDIDTVVKRSSDGGRTWSDETVVLDLGDATIGNPCPIVDPVSGRITLIATWNRLPESKIAPGFGEDSRRLWVTDSDDDGLTWSAPRNITEQVKQPTWSWIASGPCSGIVLEHGPHRGRYVVGFNHRETAVNAAGYYAHVIYSDDSGKTWNSSKSFAARNTNECEAVELADGSVMLNTRNHGAPLHARSVAVSTDGGETWEETHLDPALPEPQCMGSIKRLRMATAGEPAVLLFSNPASATSRANLTLRASFDEGKTWPRALLVKPGDAAYSHLAVLPDGKIALAYETEGYKRIVFQTFELSDLKDVK